MGHSQVFMNLLHVGPFYFCIKLQEFLTKGNEHRNLPGRVGIGSWLELAGPRQWRTAVCVAPRARMLGRTSPVLSGKVPVWEQAGKRRARGRGCIPAGQPPSPSYSSWASPGVRLFCFHSHLDCLLRVEMSWCHPQPADSVSVGCCLGIRMWEKLSGYF